MARFEVSKKGMGWRGKSPISWRRRLGPFGTGVIAIGILAVIACNPVDRPNDAAQSPEAVAAQAVDQTPASSKDSTGDEALAPPDDAADDAALSTPDDAADDAVATARPGSGGSGSGRASKSISESGGISSLGGDDLIVGPAEPSDQPNLAPTQPADVAGVDLVTLAPSNLYVSYEQGVTRTLRFATNILNQGAMPVEVHGRSDPESGETNVFQRLYTPSGTFTERFIGIFVFAPGHEHWHVDDMVRYELWSAQPDGTRRFRVARTIKASFCLRDDIHLNTGVHPENSPDQAVYVECEQSIQGISVGWIDFYNSGLPGQEIVIAGLPNGTYALLSTVNAGGVLQEEDTDNNTAVTLFNLVGDNIVILDQSSDARTE